MAKGLDTRHHGRAGSGRFMTTAQENGGMRMSTPLRAPDGKSTISVGRRPIRTPTGSSARTPPSGDEKADIYDNLSLNAAMMASYGIASSAPPGPTMPRIFPHLRRRCYGVGAGQLHALCLDHRGVTSDLSFFVKMGEMAARRRSLNPVTGAPEIKPEATDAFTPREVQLWSWGSLKTKFRESTRKSPGPGCRGTLSRIPGS